MGSMDWRMADRKDALLPGKVVSQTVWSEQGDGVFYEVYDREEAAPGREGGQAAETPPAGGQSYESGQSYQSSQSYQSGQSRQSYEPVLVVAETDMPATGIARPVSAGRQSLLPYIWLAVFVAGLVGGTWFANHMAADKIPISGTWMADTVDKILDFDGNVGLFIHILIKRGGIFIFLAGMTLLCRRSLVLYLSTAYFGFCFGVVISSMTIVYGPKGLLQLLGFLLPHYLLYVPAYILLARWAARSFTPRRGRARKLTGADASALLFIAAMVICGCVLEGFVNPIWIHFFEKI